MKLYSIILLLSTITLFAQKKENASLESYDLINSDYEKIESDFKQLEVCLYPIKAIV